MLTNVGLFEESRITSPPAGAACWRVIVPVEAFPPFTVLGLNTREAIPATWTVMLAVRVCEPRVAVMVTGVAALTGLVVTVNVAVVAPEATVTVEGTEAAPLLEDRLMTNPPTGAGELIVTVPVEFEPPTGFVGATVTEDRLGACTVRFLLTEDPELFPAVITAITSVATRFVVIVNVVELRPAGMVTVGGTWAFTLLLPRESNRPPGGATSFPARLIVAVDEVPPGTDDGFSTMFRARARTCSVAAAAL
jgi:hypothetical protein